MKCLTLPVACLFIGFAAAPLQAQTDAAREFEQVQQQRDKAIAAAIEPINRRYQQSLEQLLRRATQSNDLDTAVKIKAALASLPQEAAKQLAGDWALRASTGYGADVTFRTDGTGTHSGYGKFQWRIEGNTLYLGAADRFQLPVKDGKLKGANNIGNELTLTKK